VSKTPFSHRCAVVLGASRGIGFAAAAAFADAGATTYFLSRSGADVRTLRARGKKAFSIRVDATNARDLQDVFRRIIKLRGGVDILVNNLAVNQCVPIEKISLDDWNLVLATNLTSLFLSSKLCLPAMKRKRYGKIVNVSSVAARNRSLVSGVHYVCSKAGVIGFTRQLAFEAAPYGINVNAVCPGQTRTPMLVQSMTKSQIRSLEKSIPLRRVATPEEQAKVISFLASEESRYMSGAVLDVNGGQI